MNNDGKGGCFCHYYKSLILQLSAQINIDSHPLHSDDTLCSDPALWEFHQQVAGGRLREILDNTHSLHSFWNFITILMGIRYVTLWFFQNKFLGLIEICMTTAPSPWSVEVISLLLKPPPSALASTDCTVISKSMRPVLHQPFPKCAVLFF